MNFDAAFAPPALPAQLHIHTDVMSFIEATSAVNLSQPSGAPVRAQLVPARMAEHGVTLMEVVEWLRSRLNSPAHLLPALLPTRGEDHELEFEDILDGEAFRMTWRRICHPFGTDALRAGARRR